MKKNLFWLGLISALLVQAGAKIDNLHELRKAYGISKQYDRAPVDRIKIAILDRGFAGYQDVALPASTTVVEDFRPFFGDTCPLTSFASSTHGRVMAQTVWAMTGNNPVGPQLFLLNSEGLENFECAVRYAREVAQVDIILFSQNFEYGGNFKGDGFINEVVNQATSDGILWINAAGNYAGRVYTGTAPAESTTLRLRSNIAENPVSITLAWTGASNDKSIGTDLDYDLELYDGKGKRVTLENFKQVRKTTRSRNANSTPQSATGESEEGPSLLPAPPKPGIEAETVETEPEKVQAPEANEPVVAEAPSGDDRKEDLHPFETFTGLKLDQNDPANPDETYHIRVVRRGGPVNPSDSVRVVVLSPMDRQQMVGVSGRMVPSVEFLDATQDREIMIPADNPNVITVGDLEAWSARGPTLDGRSKPEIVMPRSTVAFNTGFNEAGTSHAAAILAGIVVQLKALQPSLERTDIIRLVKSETLYNTQRFPKPGTLPEGSRPVSPDQIRNAHPFYSVMLDHLQKQIAPNLVFEGFVTPEGRYVLGMNHEPATILNGFPWDTERNNLHLLEYFITLTAGTNTKPENGRLIWALHLKGETTPGFTQKYPWETFRDRQGRPIYSPADFIELRRVEYEEVRSAAKKVGNLWANPTPEDLKRVLSEKL